MCRQIPGRLTGGYLSKGLDFKFDPLQIDKHGIYPAFGAHLG
jgi:hypothetical protein